MDFAPGGSFFGHIDGSENALQEMEPVSRSLFHNSTFPIGPPAVPVGDQTHEGASSGALFAPLGDTFDWDHPSLYVLTPEEMGLPPDGSCVSQHVASPLPPGPSLSANSQDDENVPVRDVHAATWAGRNATRPVIKLRAPPRPLTEAAKNSHKIAREQRQNSDERLRNAIKEFVAEQNAKIEAIAKEHNAQPKRVRALVVGATHYQSNRNVQLYNALLSAKAQEVNTGLQTGERHSLKELHKMVAADPKMQNLSDEKKQEYLSALSNTRDTQKLSVRANNAAAARDVLKTVESIQNEMDHMRDRTGVYATLIVVRGHVNDTIQSTIYGTDNSEDFWEDDLRHSLADICRRYEQWACAQSKNLVERDSLQNLRKQITRMIMRGLVDITGKSDIVMNYRNYETSIVQGWGVKLVGWPDGISFVNPSHLGTVSDLRRIRDALKSKTCYWKALTAREREDHRVELQAREVAGEAVKVPRKKRCDSGVRKRKGTSTEGGGSSSNTRPAKRRRGPAPKSNEYVDTSDDEQPAN